MGVDAADYDCDGLFDVVKTNFAGDTTSLYRNQGNFTFDEQAFQAGLGRNTRFLGWGAGFLDYDNDGWADIFLCNGHVYPEVRESAAQSGYRERKVVYRNLRNGRFEDVSESLGPGILEQVPGAGCAFGDFDNDGDVDVLVNCVNDSPQLLRCDSNLKNNWIKIKLTGTRSNRSAIGARVYCRTGSHNRCRKCAVEEVTCRKAICGCISDWAARTHVLSRSDGRAAPRKRSVPHLSIAFFPLWKARDSRVGSYAPPVRKSPYCGQPFAHIQIELTSC